MTRLSVNVNKLATLRNSRGKNRPDVTEFAEKILTYGVAGITVHPRPDGRHIRPADVAELHNLIRRWNASHATPVELNIEGFPSPEYLGLLSQFPSAQATLVPDPPDALTSNAGWDLERHEDFLRATVTEIRKTGARISLFVDPFQFTPGQETALSRIGADRIELYTERYADAFSTPERPAVTARYKAAAAAARAQGVGVNAGHDLSQENLLFLVQEIPWIEEVSIGHALFCEAIEQGLAVTVRQYLHILDLQLSPPAMSLPDDANLHSSRA